MSFCACRIANGSSKILGEERSRAYPTAAAATLAVVAMLASALVLGDEIRINRGDCTSGVHLVARDARLSDVLMRLSQSLGFQLSFEAESDPLINFDAAMLPADLVARLASDANISSTQNDDPRCTGQKRIVKLWVLSNSGTALRRPRSTPQQALQVQHVATQAEAQEALQVQRFLAETHGFTSAAQKASP